MVESGLQNGDQVEIITSNKQTPKEDWLNFVITAKAKSKIKSSLKDEKRRIADEGREILDRKLKSLKIPSTIENINKIYNDKIKEIDDKINELYASSINSKNNCFYCYF